MLDVDSRYCSEPTLFMVIGCCVCRYEDGQVGGNGVDMTQGMYRQIVENALASCFMAVVPDRDKTINRPSEGEGSVPSATQ